MKLDVLNSTVAKLEELVRANQFEQMETDTLEIKPVPPTSGEWKEIYKSICALLNSRGGYLILGIRECNAKDGEPARYEFPGWDPNCESKLKDDLWGKFTDRRGDRLDLKDMLERLILRPFLHGQIAILLVGELPADRKFVFFGGKAFRRIGTGDHSISDAELERQEEFCEESRHARELDLIAGTSLESIDLDKLNEYITQLNQPTRVETIKPDLQAARPLLEKKYFLKDGVATVLGILVCGHQPDVYLGFRSQLHCFVDVPQEIARDKQVLNDNVLPLMEGGLGYVLRNIHVGVSLEHGGTARPQYPESLLRETINNALAHRDYSIDKQVFIVIKPGELISIENPGSFKRQLLFEDVNHDIPIRRILPEAKPRNPKLADVLSVYRKWEGRGIGMATLVDLCLQNEIDLPYYRLRQSDVTLFLCAGQLLDDPMRQLFKSFDRFISERLDGGTLSEPQQLILAYLIKSELANDNGRYTILLTPDNNHSTELRSLERAGLIEKHRSSTAMNSVYIVARPLMRREFTQELRGMFGLRFDGLNAELREILSVVYRYGEFSTNPQVSAKMASFDLWPKRGRPNDIRQFDAFYRRVRKAFNQLAQAGLVIKPPRSRGYVLNPDGGRDALKPVDEDRP